MALQDQISIKFILRKNAIKKVKEYIYIYIYRSENTSLPLLRRNFFSSTLLWLLMTFFFLSFYGGYVDLIAH